MQSKGVASVGRYRQGSRTAPRSTHDQDRSGRMDAGEECEGQTAGSAMILPGRSLTWCRAGFLPSAVLPRAGRVEYRRMTSWRQGQVNDVYHFADGSACMKPK